MVVKKGDETIPVPVTSVEIKSILWDGISLWKIPFHVLGGAKRRHLRIKRGADGASSINVRVVENKNERTSTSTSTGMGVSVSKSRIETAAYPMSLELISIGRNYSKSQSRQIKFDDIIGIRRDSFSDVFNAFRARNGPTSLPHNSLCFSIATESRTFDLYAESPTENNIMLEEILNLMSSLSSSAKFTRQPARRQIEVDTLKKKQFFAAAKCGNVEKFRWYLQQGYNVDTEESDGKKDTALIAACRMGRIDVVQIALEFDAKNDPHPSFGQTALQVAVSSGHAGCVQMILETASLSDADHIIANHEDSVKEAPLHVASRCGNLEILELLLKHGANICALDAKGRTCLHCAVQSGHTLCLRYLLQMGGDELIEERDNRGLNCLHIAAKQNCVKCAETLLKSGADVTAMTPEGIDVLEIAKIQKARKFIDLVLQHYDPYQSESLMHVNEEKSSDLFQGLEVFHGTPALVNLDSLNMQAQNNDLQSLSPITHQTEQTGLNQPAHEPHSDSFYYGEHLWSIFLHHENGCVYPYFLRAYDNHSQWEDPRHVGIIGFEMHHSYEEGDSRTEHAPINSNTANNSDRAMHYHHYTETSEENFANQQIVRHNEDRARKIIDEHGKNSNHGFVTTSEQNVSSTHGGGELLYQGVDIHVPPRINSSTPYATNEERFNVNYSSRDSNIREAMDQQRDLHQMKEITGNEFTSTVYQGNHPSKIMEKGQLTPQYPSSTTVLTDSRISCVLEKKLDFGDAIKARAGKYVDSVPDPASAKKEVNPRDTRSFDSAPDPARIKLEITPLDTRIPSFDENQLDCRDAIKARGQESLKCIPEQAIADKKLLGSELTSNGSKGKIPPAMPLFPAQSTLVTNSSKTSTKDTMSRYKKMVLMGVPVQAVLHKMEKDAVDSEVVALFKQENQDDDNSDKTNHLRGAALRTVSEESKPEGNMDLSKYKRMMNVGVLLDSVVHKMTNDGIGDAEIESFKRNNGNKDDNSAMKESAHVGTKSNVDPKLKRYTMMVSVGVPFESVVHKMQKDGCSMEQINKFKDINSQSEQCTTRVEDHKEKLADAKKLLESDDSLSKFKKMIIFGVPVQAIMNKMRQEGVDDAKINAFASVNGESTDSSISRRNTTGNLGLPPPPQTSSRRRTSVAMQKIHWKPVSQERVQNSLWASAVESETAIDDAEVKELESLFGERKNNFQRKGKAQPGISTNRTSKKENISLIDTKRSYNITISLAQFKAFKSFDDLCQAVVSMDSSKLNGEQLQNMMALMPTQDELKKMKEYRGTSDGMTLGRAELFFLAISKTPRFNQKLSTFMFVLQFTDGANQLLDKLKKLERACTDIANNGKLAGILKRLLAIGNLVNEGAGKQKAAGITMDSLLKTANKTGTDGKTRVIDVVVANFLKQDQGEGGNGNDDDSSIAFWTELKSVNEAARLDIRECKKSLRDTQNGINKVKFNLEKEEDIATCSFSSAETESAAADALSTLFMERSKSFLLVSNTIVARLEAKIKETERSFETLCMFFAEDPKTCKAPSIFQVILNFSRVVQMSTETWKRKARAAKRRATMNSTPIKTTRTRSLTCAHQTAVTRPTSTPILLTNNEMNVPSVNRNANVATTLTQNKAKPQSPKPPAARIHESPKRAGTGREEMIKSIQLTMKPQKNLTETNGNGDNDDADAWE